MILQPIIENSISHGFSDPPHSNCVILIQTFTLPASEKPLIIRITDNGNGMEGGEEEVLKQNLAGDGKAERYTALCNIYRRMKICFGPEFQFSIKNKPGFYFAVEMSVPLEMELAIPEIKAAKMYRVILVDDEPWAFSGLEEIIPWNEYGFELCGSCANA
jgi:LytS/YehU family sensor histidine kinase